jgi:hypothetical protein
MALFTSTGGVVYHWRARRHRRGLWLPFRRAVQVWLEESLPPSGELILIGPSAGHCLPLLHLARFERLLLLEPDGLGRLLLRRRLGATTITQRSDDLLVAPLLRGAPGLDQLLDERPEASVLFCNLLGQLQFGLSEAEHAAWRAAFQSRVLPALAGRRWASFHDRWSLERAASEPELPPRTSFERAPSDEELGRALFGRAASTMTVTVVEHGTAGLFPEAGLHHYFVWQLTPAALHVVEAVSG